MKDLKQRLGFGTLLVAALVVAFRLDRETVVGLSALALVAMALAAQAEFYDMLRAAGHAPRKATGLALGLLVLAAAWFDWATWGPLVPALPAAYLVGEMLTRRVEGAPARIGATLLGWMAVPVLLAYVLLVRRWEDGWEWLIFLVAVCKSGDSAAYLIGSAFGRRKLIPEVSPNKSWEGAFGSLAGSLLAAWIVSMWAFDGRLEPAQWIAAGVVVNLAAQCGDLVESLLKRGCATKDSASMLPAFGGSFDMVDSFLVAGPALYAWLHATGYRSGVLAAVMG